MEIDLIYIEVDYRGTSPADTEKAIVLPIESALEGLSGIDTVKSLADDGYARISSFPDEIEPLEVAIPDISLWPDVIKIEISGDIFQYAR